MQKLVFLMAFWAVRGFFALEINIRQNYYSKSTVNLIFEFLTLFSTFIWFFDAGIVNSLANLLSLIPKTLSNLLDGLLGSSRRGDIATLTTHLVSLTQKLPGELKSGGENAVLATLQTVEDIFLNLGKNIRKAKPGALKPVYGHLQLILFILQGRNFAFDFKLISKF